jgi:glycosyltransferase involved in cell wall biosynthesis
MKALARQLALRRVEFRGPLFGQEKLEAYARADAYVLPSWSENFGYTVAEALACGTPAITTRETPWPVLEREGCGWWIDTGGEALAACLREVLATSRAELDRRGNIGRDWVGRELGWSGVGRRMLASYRWLLEGGDRPDWIST